MPSEFFKEKIREKYPSPSDQLWIIPVLEGMYDLFKVIFEEEARLTNKK